MVLSRKTVRAYIANKEKTLLLLVRLVVNWIRIHFILFLLMVNCTSFLAGHLPHIKNRAKKRHGRPLWCANVVRGFQVPSLIYFCVLDILLVLFLPLLLLVFILLFLLLFLVLSLLYFCDLDLLLFLPLLLLFLLLYCIVLLYNNINIYLWLII